jgi:hypothetical protein
MLYLHGFAHLDHCRSGNAASPEVSFLDNLPDLCGMGKIVFPFFMDGPHTLGNSRGQPFFTFGAANGSAQAARGNLRDILGR